MPCQLDAKPDFVVDFCLPSPVASSQPLRLPDGRWELGMSIQTVMVKSSVQMVTHLQEWATYASFKAWLLAVEDWVLSHTHTMPNNLGPATILHCGLSNDESRHIFMVGDYAALGTM